MRHPLLVIAVFLVDSGDRDRPTSVVFVQQLLEWVSPQWPSSNGFEFVGLMIPFGEQKSGRHVSASLFGDGYESLRATGPLRIDISSTFL